MNYVRTKQSYKNPTSGIGVGKQTYQRGRADNRILHRDAHYRTDVTIDGSDVVCPRVWLTVKGAAEYLGVSKNFIRGLLNDGDLNTYRLKSLIFIRKEELDELIEKGGRL